MSDGNINIQFTVEDAAAFRAWQRQQEAARKLKKELDTLKNAGNQAGNAIGGIGNAIGGIGAKATSILKDAGAQLLGVGTAVGALITFARQLISEIENIKRKNKEAGQANVGIVPSLNTAAQNAGGAMKTPQILAMAKETAQKTGQTVSKVLDTFGAAWAAGAPEDEADARATAPAVEAVLNTFPSENAETTAEIASATKSLMKREGMTAEEALGFYLKAAEGNFSRGNGPLAKHVIPAGLKGTAFGDSLPESQATVNTFSQSMMDPDGALSSHAANVFQEQLRERLPNLPNTQSRVEYLRQHPKEAKAYMDGGRIAGKKFDAAKKGEGASIPTIEGILGLNNAPAFVGLFDEMKKGADKIQAAGGDRAGLASRAAQQRKSNLSTGPQVLEAQQRRAASAKELTQLADSEAAAMGIASEGFAGIMESSDLPAITQWAKSQGHFIKGGGANDLADELDRLATRQVSKVVPDWSKAGMAGTPDTFGGIGRGSFTKTVPNENATVEDKIKAANYRAAANRIRELEAQRKAGVNETNKAEEAGLPKPGANAGPQQKPAAAQPPAGAAATLTKPVVPQKFTEQQQNENLDAVIKAKQDLITLHAEIKADDNFTPEERAAAQQRMQRAQQAGQTVTQPGAVNPFAAPMMGDLNQQIGQLIEELKKNTEATKGNTQQPPVAATSTSSAVPRTPQASRRLDRRYSNIT